MGNEMMIQGSATSCIRQSHSSLCSRCEFKNRGQIEAHASVYHHWLSQSHKKSHRPTNDLLAPDFFAMLNTRSTKYMFVHAVIQKKGFGQGSTLLSPAMASPVRRRSIRNGRARMDSGGPIGLMRSLSHTKNLWRDYTDSCWLRPQLFL